MNREVTFNSKKINLFILIFSQSWSLIIISIPNWDDRSQILPSLVGAFIFAPIVMIAGLRWHFRTDRGLNLRNFKAFLFILLIAVIFLFIDFTNLIATGFIINALFLLMWGMVPYTSAIEINDLGNVTELSISTHRLYLRNFNRKIVIDNDSLIDISKPESFRGPGSRGFWYYYITIGNGFNRETFPFVPVNEKGVNLARKLKIMFPTNKLIISEKILSYPSLFNKFTYPPVKWSKGNNQINSNNLTSDFNLITTHSSFKKLFMVSGHRLIVGFIIGLVYLLIYLTGLLLSFAMTYVTFIQSLYPLTIFGLMIFCSMIYFYAYIIINSMVHPIVQKFGHPIIYQDEGQIIFCYKLWRIRAQKIIIPHELNSNIEIEDGICFLQLYLDSEHEFKYRFGSVRGFENGIVNQ